MRTIEQEDIDIPEIRDEAIAARTASFMVLVAGLWLFVSPWAYYGGSETTSAWNSRGLGIIIFLLALGRCCRPLHTAVFSVINAILGAWLLISPWIFGYSSDTGRLVNSLCVGVFILGMSIGSALTNRRDTSQPLWAYQVKVI